MAWHCNSVHKIPRIHSYAEAHKYFTSTPKPPRSLKWIHWDTRPLKGVRDEHYAIRRGTATRGLYYDLVLYKTALVRYWQPDDLIADGTEHVWLRGWDTPMSWSFLSRAGWWQGRTLKTTEGGSAKLFLNHNLQDDRALICNGWSANLVVKNDLLVVEQSKHVPAYVYKSTREDTQRRAEFKQTMDTFATLMCYRIPEMHRTMRTTYWSLFGRGKPFGGVTTSLPWEFDYHLGNDMPEGMTNRLIVFSEDVYATMIAKRWYAKWERRNHSNPYSNEPEHYIPPPLDADVYKKGLLTALLRRSGKNGNSLRVTIPQFANTLPRNYSCF